MGVVHGGCETPGEVIYGPEAAVEVIFGPDAAVEDVVTPEPAAAPIPKSAGLSFKIARIPKIAADTVTPTPAPMPAFAPVERPLLEEFVIKLGLMV